ncbi:hypothetical protein HOK021_74650 [Streptomyces hygroscopicus]|nr:hypothetical protein HOK021_74650 [Streptomyces hygroscopicus]
MKNIVVTMRVVSPRSGANRVCAMAPPQTPHFAQCADCRAPSSHRARRPAHCAAVPILPLQSYMWGKAQARGLPGASGGRAPAPPEGPSTDRRGPARTGGP